MTRDTAARDFGLLVRLGIAEKAGRGRSVSYEQFFVMAFAQLTYRESLRDIETCLLAVGAKLYHSGIRQPTARSTLADANEKRDWRIFSDFAHVLIEQASSLDADEPFGVELKRAAYALDSTTIDLCLAVPLGQVPPPQSGHQTAHAPDPARQLPHHDYSRRQAVDRWPSQALALTPPVEPFVHCPTGLVVEELHPAKVAVN